MPRLNKPEHPISYDTCFTEGEPTTWEVFLPDIPEELEVYRNGLLSCSVCTNITDEKRIEELVNQKNPTGIESKWEINHNEPFYNNNPNQEKSGCPCEQKPLTHKHYLLQC